MKKILSLVVSALLFAGALKADYVCPAMNPRGTTNFTVLTYTATTICLTYTAQCTGCKILAAVASTSGGNISFDFVSATVATSSTTTAMALSATAGVSGLIYGPFIQGTWLTIVANGSSSTTAVHLDSVP